MLKNPNIEICASGKDGRWLRVAAKAVRDDRREARQHMLDANPELKDMYSADDGICEVFYLKDAVGAFYTFGKNPETVRF